VPGMGRGNYHSVDALGYKDLDSIRGTGLGSYLFLPHHHQVLSGGGGPQFSQAVSQGFAVPAPVSAKETKTW